MGNSITWRNLVARKTPQDANFLRSQLSKSIRPFYTAELLESSKSRGRLARPSGSKIADIGVLMHCQSNEGNIYECWDTDSMSIQALTQKGLSHDFAFVTIGIGELSPQLVKEALPYH